MHGDGVDLLTALAQQVFGLHQVANSQIVGFGSGSRTSGVVLVGAEDASASDAAEQSQELGLQGGGLQLVDCCRQLVADVGQGVRSRAELAEVISGVAEATVQQSHDLLVSRGALWGEVASAGGAPVRC